MMYEQQQAGPAEQVIRMDLMKSSGSVGSAEQEGRIVDLLDMSGMSLHTLPNPSFNVSFLHKLDLSNNYLQSIPESLTASLVNVAVLDVHSNQLKELPNAIGCLSNLKLLNVSANLLRSLPKSIENCRSLEELNANFNTLTRLPDNLGFQLINLKKLCVNSNKLVLLPSSTSYLPNLRILDARLNCLRSLPKEFENLIHLEILNISQNFQHLATIPYTIGLLTSLVELHVSYNKIKILPDSLGCLKKLQKLSVEGNPLISPPLEVVEQGLYKLKEYWNGHKNSPKKKSWIRKLRRYSTFNGPIPVPVNIDVNNEERQGLIVVPSSYNQIQTLASPRHAGRSLLSTKSCFT